MTKSAACFLWNCFVRPLTIYDDILKHIVFVPLRYFGHACAHYEAIYLMTALHISLTKLVGLYKRTSFGAERTGRS